MLLLTQDPPGSLGLRHIILMAALPVSPVLILKGTCQAERQGAVVLPVGSPCPWLISMWSTVATDLGSGTGGKRRAPGPPPDDAAHCRSLCPRQVPSQQRPLPAPGLPGAASAPEHGQCRPLGEQASEELWAEVQPA